jgi:hypothetical protein
MGTQLANWAFQVPRRLADVGPGSNADARPDGSYAALVLFLLLACHSEPGVSDPGDTDVVEHVGGYDRTQTAPGSAWLDCDQPLPYDGKTGCTLRIVDDDGAVQWDGLAAAGLHGRSSLGFPKPQIAVELRDGDDADARADLFGLGRDGDWLLNGMYIDRALLRNRFAWSLLADASGEWAPQTAYVELWFNQDYEGVYLLEERIEPGTGRAPVPDDVADGSTFVVRADEEGQIPSTVEYGPWLVMWPDPTPPVVAAVSARLHRMESRLLAEDPAVFDELDEPSLVAFVLLEEFAKNNDAFYLSHHLVTEGDGRIHVVPWDLDLTLDQPLYNDNTNPESWILYRPDFPGRAAAIPGFRELLAATWADWRAGPLTDDAAIARLEREWDLLGPAIGRNFDRWPIGDIQFGGDQLPPRSSFAAERAAVEAFVLARLHWMDANVASW